MLLAIDVGNTNMVFGLYDGDKLRGSFRISTNSERTSDELGMLIAQYYHFHDIACADTTAVVIASVVPPVMYTLINAIRKYLFVQPVIAGRDADIGIENCYANPRGRRGPTGQRGFCGSQVRQAAHHRGYRHGDHL